MLSHHALHLSTSCHFTADFDMVYRTLVPVTMTTGLVGQRCKQRCEAKGVVNVMESEWGKASLMYDWKKDR